MNPLHTLLTKQREELSQIIKPSEDRGGFYTSKTDVQIVQFLEKCQQELLAEIVKVAEGMKKLGYDDKWPANSIQQVYNQALSDLITTLTKEK